MEAGSNSAASKHNTDEKYMAVMKPLQFGKLYCTVDLDHDNIVTWGLIWFMVFNATFSNISVISWRSWGLEVT